MLASSPRSRTAQHLPQSEIQRPEKPDQGHRVAQDRNRGAGRPASRRSRTCDRPQHAGAPAQRAGRADARGHVPRRCQTPEHRGDRVAPDQRAGVGVLRNTARSSTGWRSPELVEIKAAPVRRCAMPSGSDSRWLTLRRPVADPSWRCRRRHPPDAGLPASAAGFFWSTWASSYHADRHHHGPPCMSMNIEPTPGSTRCRPSSATSIRTRVGQWAAAVQGGRLDGDDRPGGAAGLAGPVSLTAEEPRRAQPARPRPSTQLAQAINLDELRQRSCRWQGICHPAGVPAAGKAEMTRAVGHQPARSRPAVRAVPAGPGHHHDHYAELPIALRATGPLPRRRRLRGGCWLTCRASSRRHNRATTICRRVRLKY